MVEVSGVWVRGRPWLDWMIGLKVVLGSRMMTCRLRDNASPDMRVECPGAYVDD